MVLDDFLVDRIFIEDYRAAQMNVEIFKRYREQVLLVKLTETLQTWFEYPTIADSVQVCLSFLGEPLGLQ